MCGGWDEAERGQGKRCSGFTTADGSYCNCSRDEYAGAIAPNAAGLYGHKMRGSCKCGTTHGEDSSVTRERPSEYVYQDERGRDVLRVCIQGHGSAKKVWQQHWDGHEWQKGRGTARRILYRLPELLASTGPVYVVEGERDVETLRSRGLTATTNAEGAGKWRHYDASPLRGREVRVVADKDGEKQNYAGQKHALEVKASLEGASEVTLWQCPVAKDVTEHFASGGTIYELVPMAAIPSEATSKVQVRPVPLRLVDGPAWGDEEPPGPDREPLPEIRMGTDVHRVLDELDEKLGPVAMALFQRSYQLVTVVGAVGGKRIADGTPIVREISAPGLLPQVTRHVQMTATEAPSDKAVKLANASGTKAEWETRNVIPSPTILNAFLARGDWHHIRPIVGVSESPFMRPDGTICQTPGYDAATGYLYQPNADYPQVEDSPTQMASVAALEELLDVFCDFPYATPESRLVPVSAVLSILARPAISGPVPGHLFDASVIGSGKTLQCDVSHLIATGRVPAHATWPAGEEDQEKLLSTYANSAPPGIVIDNVKGVLGGSALEQTLTSESVEFRQLGGLTLRTLPWRSVLMFSGNNVALSDDMIRRVIMSRLESSLENPTERVDFKRPALLDWVRAERPRLVHLALVVLRAYAAKGWPSAGVRLASYEAWAKVVAGALQFARGGDVTKAQPPRERAALDDSGAAATLANKLQILGPEPKTMREIIAHVYPAPGRNDPPDNLGDIRDALEALVTAKGPNGPSALSVSKKLSKFNGRWFDDRCLRSFVDDHSKIMMWRVESRRK